MNIEQTSPAPTVSSEQLLGVLDRQKVIEGLFDAMTQSSFAEGCEERIARGLEARTDAQLLELAKSKMTWTPNESSSPATPKTPHQLKARQSETCIQHN